MPPAAASPSSLSAKAGGRIVAHCSKYPWANVFGLLLAPADDSKQIQDIVPLFHTPILAPTLQVALLLAQELCAQTNQRIVGAYYSGETAGLALVKHTTQQILKQQQGGKGLLLVVKPALEVAAFELTNSQWQPVKAFTCDVDGAIQQARTNNHTQLADFEDCLDNPSLDFRS